RGLKIVWDVRAHVNTMDEPMLKAMKRAGCERIHYGIEAGNNRMLRELRKNTTVERVRQTIDLTKKAGIEALAYFMIGNPTETSADIDDTLRLAESLKPHYCHFTIFCPYPATEFYERGLAEGHIKQDVWRLFATAPGPDFQLPVWEEHFTRAELYEKIVMMYKKFYLRPWHVMGQLMRIRSMGEFKRKARAGFQVLRMKAAEVARLDLSKSVKMK
ncbi:MAG: radical SAM protein, partial [Nitrospinota bacterium]|nr:radical SAM protein [Nitrospinota bacterium]